LFWSFCYLLFRCVLQLASLRPRSDDFKELEIVVLRHELAVLRWQGGATEVVICRSRSPCDGKSAAARDQVGARSS
jgi:hypothetical protein